MKLKNVKKYIYIYIGHIASADKSALRLGCFIFG